MIPKIIHYCWFGGAEKSPFIQKCISSWKKYCPEYSIVEWNENNFDINICSYTTQAYREKKWAFVSDYARLFALYTQGGLYLDTDVELLKPLNCFMENQAFTGFESKDCPVTAVMGAEPRNPVIYELMHYYDNVSFINKDGGLNLKTNTHTITDYFLDMGVKANGKIQCVNGWMIYPQIYFCPNTLSMVFGKPSRRSYSIHYGIGTWRGDVKDKSFWRHFREYLVGIGRNTIGTDTLERIRDLRQ